MMVEGVLATTGDYMLLSYSLLIIMCVLVNTCMVVLLLLVCPIRCYYMWMPCPYALLLMMDVLRCSCDYLG